MFKWIIAFLGYLVFRLPGAVVGFLLGSLFDNYGKSQGTTYGRNIYTRPVTPADFELNLLSLCALVIKADGSVSQRELDYVRQYFVSTYGKGRANATFRIFNEVIKNRELSARNICAFMLTRTRYEVRLQLIHFLFGIAQADGRIGQAEEKLLKDIAAYLRVFYKDFESIRAMFIKESGNAYKILEVNEDASVDEIKKAYRSMVKKYHPDKVRTQDEAIRKGAEEKFKEVQKAYEEIQRERGF